MKITYWDAVLDLLNYTEISGPIDGPVSEYTFHKNQTAPTEEEIQNKLEELQAAEPFRLLRLQRDHLIAQTDWWVLPDRTATQAQLDYRQALRDLPQNTTPELDEQGNLVRINWPTPPETN